mmetsp:Transcript_25459/g.37209  ORF Transcript_25459/g.37209 Transcript_25459/m.37209 type:complete len:81 (+) Transcript_25459:70-312(+)
MLRFILEPSASVDDLYMVRQDTTLSNPSLLHHMILFQFPSAEMLDDNRVGEGPYSCDDHKMDDECVAISGWTGGRISLHC